MDIYDPVTMAKIRTDISQCCQCRRFVDERGEYTDPPDGIENMAYSHTYCEECADKLIKSVAALHALSS